MKQCSTCSFGFFVCSIIDHGSSIACTALTRLSVNKYINLRALIPHARCLHVHMLPCRVNFYLVNSYFVHSIVFINNSILRQTHTTALHSWCTNCSPNTRVLTTQGSFMDRYRKYNSNFSLLLEAALKFQVCFPHPPLLHSCQKCIPFLIFNTDSLNTNTMLTGSPLP